MECPPRTCDHPSIYHHHLFAGLPTCLELSHDQWGPLIANSTQLARKNSINRHLKNITICCQRPLLHDLLSLCTMSWFSFGSHKDLSCPSSRKKRMLTPDLQLRLVQPAWRKLGLHSFGGIPTCKQFRQGGPASFKNLCEATFVLSTNHIGKLVVCRAVHHKLLSNHG